VQLLNLATSTSDTTGVDVKPQAAGGAAKRAKRSSKLASVSSRLLKAAIADVDADSGALQRSRSRTQPLERGVDFIYLTCALIFYDQSCAFGKARHLRLASCQQDTILLLLLVNFVEVVDSYR